MIDPFAEVVGKILAGRVGIYAQVRTNRVNEGRVHCWRSPSLDHRIMPTRAVELNAHRNHHDRRVGNVSVSASPAGERMPDVERPQPLLFEVRPRFGRDGQSAQRGIAESIGLEEIGQTAAAPLNQCQCRSTDHAGVVHRQLERAPPELPEEKHAIVAIEVDQAPGPLCHRRLDDSGAIVG